MRAIYKAFNDQEIACNLPIVQDSGCSGTPIVAPEVSIIPGDMKAIISWSKVSGASNYEVFRTEGIKQCKQGKVKLTTTTSLKFTDTGLMNGREYYYIVIPKGMTVLLIVFFQNIIDLISQDIIIYILFTCFWRRFK